MANESLSNWAEGYGTLSTNSSPPARFSSFTSGPSPSPSSHRGTPGTLSFNNVGKSPDQQSSFFPSAVSVADGGSVTPITPVASSRRQPMTPMTIGGNNSNVRVNTPFTPLPVQQQKQANEWAQQTLGTPGNNMSSMMSSASGANNCWVTVFGFSPQSLNKVIESFLSCGQIVQHVTQGHSNWVHLQFESLVGVQRSLSRNGTVIGGHTMIGVMKRREFGHSGPGLLFNTTENSRTDASGGSARKSSHLLGNESLYLQQRNKYSVAPSTAGEFGSNGAPRQQDSKMSTFINYFFGY